MNYRYKRVATVLVFVIVAATSACGGSGEKVVSKPKLAPASTTTSVPETTAPPTTPPPRWEVDAPGPSNIRINRIGVEAEVIDLGLHPDGTLQTPDDDFAQAGWYTGRAAPGEQGPTIVVGHVDNKSGPAVFFRLRELVAGDEVEIVRDDGSSIVYVVTSSEQVDKDAFPTDKVYGGTEVPELRLVTCGGEFDRSSGHYIDNIVVYGKIRGA